MVFKLKTNTRWRWPTYKAKNQLMGWFGGVIIGSYHFLNYFTWHIIVVGCLPLSHKSIIHNLPDQNCVLKWLVLDFFLFETFMAYHLGSPSLREVSNGYSSTIILGQTKLGQAWAFWVAQAHPLQAILYLNCKYYMIQR